MFTNGVSFYPAMLSAIGQATRSINMELYIFQPGKIANQFVAELSSKARAGVTVTIVVDAIGSLSLWGRRSADYAARDAGLSPISGYAGIRSPG